ncbi:guanine nucleotide-binding protein subunit alpha [Entophlyctis luteolus]|nr:guanine nucleotide-binding protein subunit alpha [Entophlyctis luteolus]
MTTTITETRFQIEGVIFRVFDVGGQRSERKKWAAYFDDISAIIYVVAINSYDQLCFEDNTTNRMVESMNLFASICNHPMFKKTAMIIFMNKIDLFQAKLKTTPIADYFPSFEGDDQFEEFFTKVKAKDQTIMIMVQSAGETGKSTVLKQLKLIYGTAYTNEERIGYKTAILANIVTCAKALVYAMDVLKIPFGFEIPNVKDLGAFATSRSRTSLSHISDQTESGRSLQDVKDMGKIAKIAEEAYYNAGGETRQTGPSARAAQLIRNCEMSFCFGFDESVPEEVADAIRIIWKDPGITHFSFMESIDRIMASTFVPTDSDILNTRIMTTTITETKFKIQHVSFRVFDVGGQRAERKKWIPYFDDVDTIIYMVAISAYDQVLVEDNTTNRLVEAMTLFSSIVNHPIFASTAIIIFMNKIDIFKNKLKTVPIAKYFPKFKAVQHIREVHNVCVCRLKQVMPYLDVYLRKWGALVSETLDGSILEKKSQESLNYYFASVTDNSLVHGDQYGAESNISRASEQQLLEEAYIKLGIVSTAIFEDTDTLVGDCDGNVATHVTKTYEPIKRIFHLGATGFEQDLEIRKSLHKAKLKEILAIQTASQIQQDPHHIPIKCIFCKLIPENQAELFAHFRSEHGFHPGNPLNLCYIPEFLALLHAKMSKGICICCEGSFPDTVVLRRHMRKKKHFRINPMNPEYDRFYVINYADFSGLRWRDMEVEETNNDEADFLDGSEFDDWEDEEEQGTMCLFDEIVLPSVPEAVRHLKEEHQFDISAIKKRYDLDEYGIIRLINYIRGSTLALKCFGCKKGFESIEELGAHYAVERHHLAMIPERSDGFWTSVEHLFPAYEGDPLLTWDAEDSEEAEADCGAQRRI